jgi:hypothetical protein
MNKEGLIRPLFDGPLDIVGDVHGEIEPLIALLAALGYGSRGEHPRGRRLVFVGDLVDKGPDSPAVVDLAMDLVKRGLAQWVMGNHELNLLREEPKAGNAWLLDPTRKEQKQGGEFSHSRVASPELKARQLGFLAKLPLALERSDLRVVHAAWMPKQIEELRGAQESIVDLFRRYELAAQASLKAEGLIDRANAEKVHSSSLLHDRNAKDVPLLEAMGLSDERQQMDNPIKVVTSGVERLAKSPFWASGQWRMCDRVAWWNEYEDATPVIVGHYWRRLQPVQASEHAATDKRDLFVGAGPLSWLGPYGNVFCVDYSIGARYEERKAGRTTFDTAIAAMRWPEREVWGERGRLHVT